MKTELLSHFYNDLNEDGIYLCYQGPLWQELLEELNDLVKKKVGKSIPTGIMGKYLTLFVELVQNVVRYSSARTVIHDGSELSHGIVVVGSRNGCSYILSGNTVDQYHKEVLQDLLKELEGCDKPALSKMFKKQLRGEIHSKSKGAGLGLIDIHRKADRVEYSFLKQGEDDFFAIKVEFSTGLSKSDES